MARFNRTTRLRTARFPSVGASVSGTVTSITDAAVPEFGDNGKIIGPKFDVTGTMLTQPDIIVETPDGEETVIHAGVGVQVAIGAAVQGETIRDLLVGDFLTVTYIADEDADELTPAKVYQAEIARPKSARADQGAEAAQPSE